MVTVRNARIHIVNFIEQSQFVLDELSKLVDVIENDAEERGPDMDPPSDMQLDTVSSLNAAIEYFEEAVDWLDRAFDELGNMEESYEFGGEA